MGRAIPVWIGHRRYAKKGDAEQACRDLIKKYPGGNGPVGPMSRQGSPQLVDDPADIAFIHDLLKLHPTPQKVIGSGIKHFAVRVNAEERNSNRCLWVWRTDGTADDFSWTECVKNAPTEPPANA